MPHDIGDHIGEHNWYQRAELSQDISRASGQKDGWSWKMYNWSKNELPTQ